MLKARSRTKRRFLIPLLLAGSTLFWFLVLRVTRPLHQDEHEIFETAAEDDQVTEATGEYLNLSDTFSGLTFDDVRLGEDLLDVSRTEADPAFFEPEPTAVVAIVPVTGYSLDTVSHTLPRFLPLSSLLQEVILLCSDSLSPAVRDRLRDVLPDDDFIHVEISVTTWLNGLDEGSALLYAARQIHADRVLVFDSDSIQNLSDDVLEILAAPVLTPLPIGPRGFSVTGGRVWCIEAGDDPKAATFLVPPFSVATSLIPPHDLPPDPIYDIWQALGKHIARARFERVGGVAVSRGAVDDAWCSAGQHKQASGDDVNRSAQKTFKAQDPTIEDPALPRQNDACSPATLSVFSVIFKSEEQLRSFGPVLCRLQLDGSSVHIATVAVRADSAQRTRTRTMDLSSCTAEFAEIPQTVASLGDWLASLACSPGTVITSELEPFISTALTRLLTDNYEPNTTLVRIPDGDVPYCDWMGSLTVDEWRNWHKPQLEISVITDDRPVSLTRLLASLSAAYFFGDAVALRINVEQTAGPQTLQLIHGFEWPYGPVFVHRRVIHGGLLPAVVESWYPRSDNAYGLMLEDDVELSPLFYAWVKMALLHYRYGRPTDRSPHMFGISLYQQKNLELRPEGRHRFNARTTFAAASLPSPEIPYLSQIPCSWGAVYFPEHWRAFHEYLTLRLSGGVLPIGSVVAPGVRSNRWTRSWKKYFIELAYLRGYVMLYPNYADYASLSTNHLEVGSHVKEMTPEAYERKKRLYQLLLLRPPPVEETVKTGLLDLPDARMPSYSDLPVLDLLGLLATEDLLRERGLSRQKKLFHCPSAPSHLRSLLCD